MKIIYSNQLTLQNNHRAAPNAHNNALFTHQSFQFDLSKDGSDSKNWGIMHDNENNNPNNADDLVIIGDDGYIESGALGRK